MASEDANAGDDSTERVPTLAEVSGLVHTMLAGGDATADVRLAATKSMRRFLSVKEMASPAKQLIDLSILGNMVAFLWFDREPSLQREAAWVLTNIASTEYTAHVVNAGAVSPLVRLLECPTPNVREQAAWCLGNIAGDSVEFRDVVLKSGALTSLLRNVHRPDNESLLKSVVWTISNLCRGTPKPDFSLVRHCIPAMIYALEHEKSSLEARADALWALSYLSDGEDMQIQAIVESGKVIPNAMTALKSESTMDPALHIIGNIVTGNAEQTQAVLDAEFLKIVPRLLLHDNEKVRSSTAWMISNIALGNKIQLEALFKNPLVIHMLVDMASPTSLGRTKIEAIHFVSNACTHKWVTPKQIGLIVHYGGINNLLMACEEQQEPEVVIAALNALGAVLKVDVDGDMLYLDDFVEADRVSALNELKSSGNDGIKQAVDKLLALVDKEKDVPELLVAVDDTSLAHEHEESKKAVDQLPAPVDEEAPELEVAVDAESSTSPIASRVGRRRARNV